MQTLKNQGLNTVGTKPLDGMPALPAKRRTWLISATGMTLLSVLLVLVIAVGAYLALARSTARPVGTSSLEELARIKDDVIPAAASLTGPSRLEELARTKDDAIAMTARLAGASRLEELEYIKGALAP